MASIASWIYDKPLRGNYTFTHDEVARAFPEMNAGSIARALTREVSKGRIMSPLRGFYVIVPDEYVLRGAVPQSFYLDDMMLHLGRKYFGQRAADIRIFLVIKPARVIRSRQLLNPFLYIYSTPFIDFQNLSPYRFSANPAFTSLPKQLICLRSISLIIYPEQLFHFYNLRLLVGLYLPFHRFRRRIQIEGKHQIVVRVRFPHHVRYIKEDRAGTAHRVRRDGHIPDPRLLIRKLILQRPDRHI